MHHGVDTPQFTDAGISSTMAPLDSVPQEIIDSLPECLRNLDTSLIELLTTDESYMVMILNEDGSLNEEKVEQLKAAIKQNTGMPSQGRPQHPFPPRNVWMCVSYITLIYLLSWDVEATLSFFPS